jgi:ribosomal protein L11 methyltransferase
MEKHESGPLKDRLPPDEKSSGRIFQPFSLGERFIVLPPHKINPAPERLPLILGPGKAFGSGEHETTASCIELLERIPALPQKKVLDYGCGTGILALAAAKLGAFFVLGLDNDPEAIETCKNNLLLNGGEKQVFFLQKDLEAIKEKGFDLILANIYDHILLKNSARLAALTKSKGDLILSGILYESFFDIKYRFQRLGFTALKEKFMEEYCTLWLQKLP